MVGANITHVRRKDGVQPVAFNLVLPPGVCSSPGAASAPSRSDPATMRVTVFGATGKIGGLVVQRLLHDEHDVIAYVRTPSTLTFTDRRLTLVAGELSDTTGIASVVGGRTRSSAPWARRSSAAPLGHRY